MRLTLDVAVLTIVFVAFFFLFKNAAIALVAASILACACDVLIFSSRKG